MKVYRSVTAKHIWIWYFLSLPYSVTVPGQINRGHASWNEINNVHEWINMINDAHFIARICDARIKCSSWANRSQENVLKHSWDKCVILKIKLMMSFSWTQFQAYIVKIKCFRANQNILLLSWFLHTFLYIKSMYVQNKIQNRW